MSCAICGVRRPKRFCPGVRGDICAICCGEQREVTVDCPLDCEYLREARKRDRPPAFDPSLAPNREIELTEELLFENERLLSAIGGVILVTALKTQGLIDYDVREAFGALVRTYRTLQSGVFYETRPPNPLATAVYDTVQAVIAEYRRAEQHELGMPRTLDRHVLALLVFLQRVELDKNNGRRRGRAFIDSLRALYPDAPVAPPAAPSIILS